MRLTITKPDSTLYEGEVKLVQLPGTEGLFEILEYHAPIVASLSAGQLRVVPKNGEEQLFQIRGGVAKGQQNELLILVQ